MRRLVFVVSPAQRQLYESLTRTFKDDHTVQVVLDRRRGERRRKAEPRAADRRRSERRTDAEEQKKLASRGYAIVGIIAARPPRR